MLISSDLWNSCIIYRTPLIKLKTNKTFFITFFLNIKVTDNYYQKHNEKLQEETHEKYQNLSEEAKNKRWKKVWDRYQNLSEEGKEKKRLHECNKNLSEGQKQKQVEFMRNYYSAHKK